MSLIICFISCPGCRKVHSIISVKPKPISVLIQTCFAESNTVSALCHDCWILSSDSFCRHLYLPKMDTVWTLCCLFRTVHCHSLCWRSLWRGWHVSCCTCSSTVKLFVMSVISLGVDALIDCQTLVNSSSWTVTSLQACWYQSDWLVLLLRQYTAYWTWHVMVPYCLLSAVTSTRKWTACCVSVVCISRVLLLWRLHMLTSNHAASWCSLYLYVYFTLLW